MEGGTSFLFAMAFFITSIYRIQTVHLDPFQLVLVGTVLEATCFLFEVPTGVVADTFSRRMSVLFGIFLLGGAFLIEGSLPLLWAVLLAQERWADAEAEFREAIRINTNLAAAHLGLWRALEAQGNWSELEQARSRVPGFSAR